MGRFCWNSAYKSGVLLVCDAVVLGHWWQGTANPFCSVCPKNFLVGFCLVLPSVGHFLAWRMRLLATNSRSKELLAGDGNPSRKHSSIDHDERSKQLHPCKSYPERQTSRSISHMKAMQSAKIRELRRALVDAGILTLDQQAKSLGVSRSTAWAVLKGNHKSSGLSAALINRMLASPQLPGSARKIILEYVEEKSAGAYGHGKVQLRQFRARLAYGQSFDAAEKLPRGRLKTGTDEADNSAPRSLTSP